MKKRYAILTLVLVLLAIPICGCGSQSAVREHVAQIWVSDDRFIADISSHYGADAFPTAISLEYGYVTDRGNRWTPDQAQAPIIAEFETLTPGESLLETADFTADTAALAISHDAGTGIVRVTLSGADLKTVVFVKVYDLSQRKIALLFDDGPSHVTDELLDILAARGASATFSVTGRNYHDVIHKYVGIEAYPDTFRRTISQGHEVANHTYSHPWKAKQDERLPPGQSITWSNYSYSAVKHEITRLDHLIQGIAGFTPAIYNPPYGYRGVHAEASDRRVMPSGIDSGDWRGTPTTEDIQRTITHSGGDGTLGITVIYLHDVYQHTVDAVGGALDSPECRDAQFMTVPEMWEVGEYIWGEKAAQ